MRTMVKPAVPACSEGHPKKKQARDINQNGDWFGSETRLDGILDSNLLDCWE